MIYALLLANRYKLDVEDIILKRLKKRGKSTVKKAYGSAKKYNEL